MQVTPNYGLKKIELTDSPPDITVHSGNFDIIDAQLKINSNEINIFSVELETVKQSVSNGKSAIATSITGKGVHTVADDTFIQMAQNIDAIKLGSGNATADKVLAPFTFTNSTGIEQIGTMPNNGDVSSAIANAVLKAGYTSGGTITNAVAENIKNGVNIAGIIGSLEGSNVASGSVVKSTSTRTLYTLNGVVTRTCQVGTIPSLAFEPKFAFIFSLGSAGESSICNLTFYINKSLTVLVDNSNLKKSIVGMFNGYYSNFNLVTGSQFATVYGTCGDTSTTFGFYNNTLSVPITNDSNFYNSWKYVAIG